MGSLATTTEVVVSFSGSELAVFGLVTSFPAFFLANVLVSDWRGIRSEVFRGCLFQMTVYVVGKRVCLLQKGNKCEEHGTGSSKGVEVVFIGRFVLRRGGGGVGEVLSKRQKEWVGEGCWSVGWMW